MKYIDTNIFLYSILYGDEKYKKIIIKIVKNQMAACTSLFTWDELVYSVKRLYGKDIAIKEGKNFLRFPNLIFLKTDKMIIDKAQEIIEKYNINPRDAIHAATALNNNVNEIISNDSDFDKIKEIKRISCI